MRDLIYFLGEAIVAFILVFGGAFMIALAG